MNATIEGNELVIRVPLTDPRPSSTGKTLIVATSNGAVRTSVNVAGKPVTVSFNAFIPAK